jgi:hypothetical protein
LAAGIGFGTVGSAGFDARDTCGGVGWGVMDTKAGLMALLGRGETSSGDDRWIMEGGVEGLGGCFCACVRVCGCVCT